MELRRFCRVAPAIRLRALHFWANSNFYLCPSTACRWSKFLAARRHRITATWTYRNRGVPKWRRPGMLTVGRPVWCEKPFHAGTSRPLRPHLLCTASEDSSFPPAFLSLCWLWTRPNHSVSEQYTADVGFLCVIRMSSTQISFHHLQAVIHSF